MCTSMVQVGLKVLGVVENMSGLQQAVDTVRFLSVPADSAQKPQDVTAAALEALRNVAPDLSCLIVQSEVFRATKGGAESMAASMGVPFLGRVPLDPALSLAGAALSSPASCHFKHMLGITDMTWLAEINCKEYLHMPLCWI